MAPSGRPHAYGRSCAVPRRLTAPGPGRSATGSMIESYVGGMQKTLISVELWDWPSESGPAATPVCVIAVARLLPKAPLCALCCVQQPVSPSIVPQPVCVPAQSASAVHDTGGLAKTGAPPLVSEQKPQKTRCCAPVANDARLWVPVVSLKAI